MSADIDPHDVDFDLDSALLEDKDTPPNGKTRTRKPRSDAGKPRGTRSTSNKKLADDLLIPYAAIFSSMMMVSPTGAAVFLSRGERTVNAIISLCSGSPKMMAALKKGAKFGPGADIAQTVVMGVCAMGIDAGRIPPGAPLAQVLGVTAIYRELHPEGPEQPPSTAEAPPPPVPPGFDIPLPRTA